MADNNLASKNKMHSPAAKTWSDSPSMPPDNSPNFVETHISAGSGSRPTPSKYKTETSAPMDPHTQGRDVPGSLK
jgi:hypothetical protein